MSSDYSVSEVFKRSSVKGYFGNDNTNLITILVPGRTLDIELDEKLWGDLYHGLQIIVQYYQTLLPSRHGSISMDPDLHYLQSKNVRRDSTASQVSFANNYDVLTV
ncbi:hypothetical protein EON65_26845 [archaeon]|nr:MAG: hypothetical protein EON65_26845 [archaeon]